MGQQTWNDISNFNRERSTGLIKTQRFITKSSIKHNFKFDYSKVTFTTAKTKVEIICPIHGSFMQLPADHVRGIGCKKCGRDTAVEKTTKKWVDVERDFRKVHNDLYDYKVDTYINTSTKMVIGCKIHGEFEQTPSNHLRHGCPKCGNISTKTKQTSNTAEFIRKLKLLYGDFYDYTDIIYYNSKTKVEVHCPIHGEFTATPNSLLNGSGCPSCGTIKQGITKKLNYFKLWVNEIHHRDSNISIDAQEYQGVNSTVTGTCNKHGKFEDVVINIKTRSNACIKCCSNVFSKPEKIISKILDNLKIQFISHYRIRKDNTYIELDFFLPEYNIAIEVNGIYWHRDQGTRCTKEYHNTKTNICIENNIQLLHLYDQEVNNKTSIIESIIRSKTGKNTKRIYARKTIIKQVDSVTANNFLALYHLQGSCKSQVYYGLFTADCDDLVCVMAFGTRQITGKSQHELIRFATKADCTVIGGFSKILEYYKHTIKAGTIVTYADRRYSLGSVYYKCGFKLINVSSPSYWYFKLPNTKLYHRYNFAKHKLSGKLQNFDINLTEWQNMKNNNYSRIWDCGQFVFELAFGGESG